MSDDNIRMFSSAHELSNTIVDELLSQVEASEMPPMRKRRIRRAMERPKIRQSFVDRVLLEGYESDAVIVGGDAMNPTYAIDWAQIIELVLKFLPLLLMFI